MPDPVQIPMRYQPATHDVFVGVTAEPPGNGTRLMLGADGPTEIPERPWGDNVRAPGPRPVFGRCVDG